MSVFNFNGGAADSCGTAAGGVQQYKIVLDLRGFPYAREIVVTDEDGNKKEGVFIPYEDCYVYRGKRGAFVNVFAGPYRSITRKSLASMDEMRRTHSLSPFLTKAQAADLQSKGIVRSKISLGWMESVGHASYAVGNPDKEGEVL